MSQLFPSLQMWAPRCNQWWHYADVHGAQDARDSIAELEESRHRWRIIDTDDQEIALADLDAREPEPFTLTQAPARGRKPVTFDNAQNTRQGKLFAGADCLPGQGELFNPNGKDES